MARMRCVLVLALAFIVAACSPTRNRLPDRESVDDVTAFRNVNSEYIGSAACFDCHEDIWRGFQEHGMAQSYYRLTRENTVENFDAPPLWHEESGFYYRVYEQGGDFWQEEYRVDSTGELTHRLPRRMDFVVGSGHAARTYLSESGGRLYELPLTWYAQKARWDFSPGYEFHNKRFDRLVPDRCMACHNSYPETAPFVEGKYIDVPDGIGCERCHGPGSLHVEERLSSPDPASEVDYTIVNPAHLDEARKLDVCEQCHLHTTVSILRDGRGPFDFRPSQRLQDHLALFYEEASMDAGSIDVISHVDRMKRSACFLATAREPNPMTCITCHNPHEGFRDKGPEYFNETCLSCHEAGTITFATDAGPHTDTGNCISCHMPRVEPEDVPHASFTDHWIRVVAEELPAPRASHDAPTLVPYYEQDRESIDGRRYLARSYIVLGTQRSDTLALKKGIELIRESLAEASDTTGQAEYQLGLTHWRLGRVEEAIPPLAEAIRRNPDIPERLNALAQAYELARRNPAETEQLYRRALEHVPALADIRLNFGRFLETRGRLDEATQQYRMAAEEMPRLATAHYNLGTAYLQQGAFQNAEQALLHALELDPDHPRALGNLGMLYASRNELDKAGRQFQRAVEAAPESATALSNLGTYYLDQEDLDRAIVYLTRAVEADPTFLEALLKLSLAHFRNEDYEEARAYAEKARAVDPGNALAQQIIDSI